MLARLAVAASVVALVASAAPWGTAGRLTVASTFPLAVLALVRHHTMLDRGGAPVAVVIVYWPVAWLHVLTTGPGAAWIVDSHMLPWLPLPGSTARVVLAWACSIGWVVVVGLAAWTIRRARGCRVATALLVVAAVVPLLRPGAFPVDGYQLLWDRRTFSHPTFTAAVLAFQAAAATLFLATHERFYCARRCTTDSAEAQPRVPR